MKENQPVERERSCDFREGGGRGSRSSPGCAYIRLVDRIATNGTVFNKVGIMPLGSTLNGGLDVDLLSFCTSFFWCFECKGSLGIT